MRVEILVTDVAGIGNTLKGFITALSLTDDAAVRCNPRALLGDYSAVLAAKHVCAPGEPPREVFSTCRFLVLKEEEAGQRDLPTEISSAEVDLRNSSYTGLFSTRVIDWSYDRGLVSDAVFHRIMRGIDKIAWTDVVTAEVARIRSQLRALAPRGVLGVSVRTWTAPHEHNIARHYSVDSYRRAIATIEREEAVDAVFVSFDNASAAPEYADLMARHRVAVAYAKPAHVTELQSAVIKMLALSECEYFVGNRISTFTELVFWFGRCRARVIAVD